MTNPHFRVSHISRKAGQNAVASAAYRSGETLTAEPLGVLAAAAYRSGDTLEEQNSGKVFNFSRKEGVLRSTIFAPADAPGWMKERASLWNGAERAEDSSTRRASARVAVDFVASLPRGLPEEQAWAYTAAFVRENFTRRGLVADVNMHTARARDGGANPHVHMMVTTREASAEGFGKKARWLDRKESLQEWRRSWERHTNHALQNAGRLERLSLRSYQARGIDWEPTKSLGYKASALEKKGIRTRPGDENRRRMQENALREAQQHELAAQRALSERSPFWASFNVRVGAGVNAARDAVHRARFKAHARAERENNEMSDETRRPRNDWFARTAQRFRQVGQKFQRRADRAVGSDGKPQSPPHLRRGQTVAPPEPSTSKPMVPLNERKPKEQEQKQNTVASMTEAQKQAAKQIGTSLGQGGATYAGDRMTYNRVPDARPKTQGASLGRGLSKENKTINRPPAELARQQTPTPPPAPEQNSTRQSRSNPLFAKSNTTAPQQEQSSKVSPNNSLFRQRTPAGTDTQKSANTASVQQAAKQPAPQQTAKMQQNHASMPKEASQQQQKSQGADRFAGTSKADAQIQKQHKQREGKER